MIALNDYSFFENVIHVLKIILAIKIFKIGLMICFLKNLSLEVILLLLLNFGKIFITK